MKPFRDCRYSVFVSYAHEDDKAENGWVTAFSELVKAKVQNRLGRFGIKEIQDVHLSGANGPVMGSLPENLAANVAASYAMIVVVHNRYVMSPWCLKELEYFRQSFGDEGLRGRLFVVAMSRGAIDDVVARPEWKRLTLPDQLWIPFYSDSDPDRPIDMWMAKDQFSPDYKQQLEKVVSELVDAIKSDPSRPAQATPPRLPAGGGAPGGPVGGVAGVVAGGVADVAAGGAMRRVLFGVPAPELAGAVEEFAGQLRARGVSVDMLGPAALEGEFEQFDGAQDVILALGKGGSPLKPFKFSAGGHLAAQRDAWLGKDKPASGLWWLDLRGIGGDLPVGKGHDELVAQVADRALAPADLLARLAPPVAPLPGAPAVDDRIRIYIESNQHDVDLWEDLGKRMTKKWDDLLVKAGDPTLPRLSLFPRGLSMQRLEKEQFDDADGIVLLWGKKPEDSLLAQIRKVDDRLPRPDPPPGIVAYLMPQQPVPEYSPIEAKYWKVLQFKDADKESVDIVPTEGDRLQKFLKAILERSLQRRSASANPGAAGGLP